MTAKLNTVYDITLPLRGEEPVQPIFDVIIDQLKMAGLFQVAEEIESVSTDIFEEQLVLDGQTFFTQRTPTEWEKMEVLTETFEMVVETMIKEYVRLRRAAGRNEEIEQSIKNAAEALGSCQAWLKAHVPYTRS